MKICQTNWVMSFNEPEKLWSIFFLLGSNRSQGNLSVFKSIQNVTKSMLQNIFDVEFVVN